MKTTKHLQNWMIRLINSRFSHKVDFYYVEELMFHNDRRAMIDYMKSIKKYILILNKD